MNFRASHIIKYILVFFSLLLCVTGCGKGEKEKKKEQPNIILISLDTLRADHLRCYGYDREISPAIDSMAAKGVLFEKVYAQSNWTLPSHVSIFSSLYPSTHGVLEKTSKIPEKTILLPQILKKEGYRTVSFNAGGFVSATFGFDRGFDVYEEIPKSTGNMENICDQAIRWIRENHGEKFFMFLHTYEVHKPYAPPDLYEQNYIPLAEVAFEKLKNILYKILNDESLDFSDYELLIARRVRGELVDFVNKVYDENEAEIKQKFSISKEEYLTKLKSTGKAYLEHIRDIYEYWHEKKEEAIGYKYILEHYDTEIIFADDQIKRLLNLLEEMELKENTLIILTSDHGEEFFDHRNSGHAIHCYNEVIQVPLIFYYPGHLPEGLRIETNTALIDIPPTILDLIGVQGPEAFEGISLLPAIAGEEGGSRILFSEHLISSRVPGFRPIAVIQDDWKYQCNVEILDIESLKLGDLEKEPRNRGFADKIAPEALYQMKQDPGETENLLEEAAEIVARMRKHAEKHLEKVRGSEVETITLDDELEKQLQDLGYIE